MVKMKGAKACVEALLNEKVKTIFGLPGGAVLPIYDELQTTDIRHILVRHEQSAAHMADGYARIAGKSGVCIATSGPGATNLVTGLATAFMDSSPVVALTGQVSTHEIGKDSFQEADITGITTPITKHSFQVKSPSEMPSAIRSAFYIAQTGRPGPVLVDLPVDIQNQEAEMEFPGEINLPAYKPPREPHPLQVKKAAELLSKAEKPLVLAGGGVRISSASQELIMLAEHLSSPVATTFMGKGCIPENHPLALGKIGVYGGILSNKAICEADVVLAVGVRFGDRATGSIREFAKKAQIIHIDADPSEIGKNVEVDVPIVGDARETLKAILEALAKVKPARRADWTKLPEISNKNHQTENKPNQIKPSRLFKELREILPPETIATVDVGQHQMWAAIHFDAYHPKSFISSGGLGTMGFGLPAALGGKIASPNIPVVNITGDGSFMMSQHELATSIQEQIPIIVLILNNNALGMVAQLQRFLYGKRFFAVKLKNPDFSKLAEAYGAFGLKVQSYDELRKAVREALKIDVTTVIDIQISFEENVLPMVLPGNGLDKILQWG